MMETPRFYKNLKGFSGGGSNVKRNKNLKGMYFHILTLCSHM